MGCWLVYEALRLARCCCITKLSLGRILRSMNPLIELARRANLFCSYLLETSIFGKKSSLLLSLNLLGGRLSNL